MDDGKLIDLVHSHPHLYDRRRSDFKDVKKRESSWQIIAQHLKYSVPDVQLRWRYLREKYNREKKSSDLSRDSGTLQNNEWEYLKRLSWLDAHVQKRGFRTSTSLPRVEKIEVEDSELYDENLIYLQDSSEMSVDPIQESESESSGVGSVTPKQESSVNWNMKQEMFTVKNVSDIMTGAFELMKSNNHAMPAASEDEDLIFSRYITSLLKSKSMKKKKVLKKQIVMDLLESSDESE